MTHLMSDCAVMLTREDQRYKGLVFQSMKKARLCDILHSVQTLLFVLEGREFLRFMMGIYTV